MLNLERLKLLIQFYNLKTMRAVSDAMLVSPSSVSTQLKILEEETNTILLEKKGRNVQLTEEGLKLVMEVKPILEHLEQIDNRFKDNSGSIHGNVRIAGFDSALRFIVIPTIIQIKKEYPNINVSITENELEQSVTGLNAHRFDLAIIVNFNTDPVDNKNNNKITKLGADQFKVIVSDKSPLATRKSVSIADLKDQEWMLEKRDRYMTKYIEQLCEKAHFKPKTFGICQSYSVLRDVVGNNLAVGVMPELIIDKNSDNLKVLELVPEVSRYFYLVSRKPQQSIRAIQIVAKEIQKQAIMCLKNELPNDR